jgi:hypothetical protein
MTARWASGRDPEFLELGRKGSPRTHRCTVHRKSHHSFIRSLAHSPSRIAHHVQSYWGFLPSECPTIKISINKTLLPSQIILTVERSDERTE